MALRRRTEDSSGALPGRDARGGDILLYRVEDRQVLPFIATGANELAAALSPDGRWLAYVSDESGRAEVYVTSCPDRRRTLVVSTRGGLEPAWSRDGRELFYRSYTFADPAVMDVRVTPGEAIALGQPTKLFSDSFSGYTTAFGYDLAPDGRGFLFARAKPGATPYSPTAITRLTVVHNWFAELERLCSTRRCGDAGLEDPGIGFEFSCSVAAVAPPRALAADVVPEPRLRGSDAAMQSPRARRSVGEAGEDRW